MHAFKKSLLSIISLSLICLPINAEAELVEDYASGRAKITSIMSNDQTGVAAFNKKYITFAETLNLTNDLNIEQIAAFFGCKLLMGHNFLVETLKYPVSPEDKNNILRNRINFVRALVENPEFKRIVEKLIDKAKPHEEEVIKLLSEFFKGKSCPELKELETIKEKNPAMYPVINYLVRNPQGRTIQAGLNLTAAASFMSLAGLYAKISTYLFKAGYDCKEPAFWTAYFGLFGSLSSYGLYKDYKNAYDKRNKLHALNQLISIAQEVEELCSDYHIAMQFKISDVKDPNGLELIETLKKDRYKDNKELLFAYPLVHAFLYTVFQQEKYLAEIFACIAELDAYNAIATKIIESREQKNKFCFATFIDADKPEINAVGFWNVLVKDAVSSDIFENKHIILTGPNAGGKTTAIRALLQNIVLAQSFGVAAAEQFEFTMFDIVHSYLNISDDILNGLSLFASEVKRAQEILQKMKSVENKKFFFALDELFTGTAAEHGETCAYKFIENILKFSGVQFIYATHFKLLTDLPETTDLCVNYKVDAPTKDSEGKLVYPYTLNKGINNVNVAMDLAKAAQLFE